MLPVLVLAVGFGVDEQAARTLTTVSAARVRRNFDFMFYSPCVSLHKRAPGRLAHAPPMTAQARPCPTVGRYSGQHATAVHLSGVKNVLTIRRKARRFV